MQLSAVLMRILYISILRGDAFSVTVVRFDVPAKKLGKARINGRWSTRSASMFQRCIVRRVNGQFEFFHLEAGLKIFLFPCWVGYESEMRNIQNFCLKKELRIEPD